MRVAILGAGVGRRLNLDDTPPKVLLRFGERSLLERHLRILTSLGVTRIDLAIGYRAEQVEAEIAHLGAERLIATHFNPDFKRGAIVSLHCLAQVFTSGEPVLFMDGDVLYDQRLLAGLLDERGSAFLMDRTTEEGDDPVKLCFAGDALVDFHKRPKMAHDWWGEWIGFARFAPSEAERIAAAAARYVKEERLDEIYEEAIRDVVLKCPQGTFKVRDVTGLPWVEIDFPEDLARARDEILPRLLPLPT